VKRRKREVYWYRSYIGLTVGLVILVPVVSVFIPAVALESVLEAKPGTGVNAPEVPTSVVISAQLTALIAGIYGVHRLFSSWLFRRNSAYAFWKAGAELKKILYTIEERWRGQTVVGDILDPNFLRDLKQGKAAAQEILRAERDTFFSAYEKIAVDLQDVVTRSTTGAAAVVGRIAEPILRTISSLSCLIYFAY